MGTNLQDRTKTAEILQEGTKTALTIFGAPAFILTIVNTLYRGVWGRDLPILLMISVYFGAVVLALIGHKMFPFFHKVVTVFIDDLFYPLIVSPVLLLFGNVKNRRLLKDTKGIALSLQQYAEVGLPMLKDIHITAAALQESTLFGRIAELRNPTIRQYHILHSHLDGHPEIGKGAHYQLAPFPVDEAQLVMRLWYFITSNLSLDWEDVKPLCSCVYTHADDAVKVFQAPFAVVGSLKKNLFCNELMKKLEEMDNLRTLKRDWKYVMDLDESSRNCFIRESGNTRTRLMPDPLPTNPLTAGKEVLTDYALIMKLPNLLSGPGGDPKHCVMLFAGCKVGGQCGATAWFFTPSNLAALASDYSSKYFQVLLEVKYNYVLNGEPTIVGSPKVLCKEPMEFSAR
jgi:hypothetical protein